jgi:arsenical pump membrane protein
MSLVSPAHEATWLIAALAIGGVLLRPWRMPEALWAVLGAAALLLLSLISAADAEAAILKGTDVYLFLIGMMVLAELARQQGLFDWMAAYAVMRSKGSPSRLFVLVYLVGTVVTVFLSNDATAVVLTPAVYAATQRAGARPLPYLLICAFIANAASFVLPISNPANLVVFGARMPTLSMWLREFGAPSLCSIMLTFIVLRFTQRSALAGEIPHVTELPELSPGGRAIAGGIAATAVTLLIVSWLDWQLGLPTFVAGVGTGIVIWCFKRENPWPVVRGITWSILPLVAGLFVIAQGIEGTGVLAPLMHVLAAEAARSPHATALAAGGVAAVACNAVNNLPLGLLASSIAHGAHLTPHLTGALLIGVDLGPNLSITGSLATLLWLVALRREGEDMSAWRFLMVGSVVMPPALIVSLASFSALAVR